MRRLVIATFGAVAGIVTLASRSGARPAAGRASDADSTELVAVYVGSAGVNQATGLRAAVREMNALLRARAAAGGGAFASVGASLEPGIAAAQTDLAAVGPFDEVALGGNWRNTVVTRYAVRHVPEVVIVERPAGTAPVAASAERELARFVGVGEITAWVRAGAPLPAGQR